MKQIAKRYGNTKLHNRYRYE